MLGTRVDAIMAPPALTPVRALQAAPSPSREREDAMTVLKALGLFVGGMVLVSWLGRTAVGRL